MPEEAKTLLIVDDDKLVQSMLEMMFEDEGYKVVLADDGNHALTQLKGHPIDLVLLDVLMPNKDGIETLIDIKRRQPKLPVLVMTGGGRCKQDFLEVAAKFGADGTVRKSSGTSEIKQLVQMHARP
jgi:CheY-like chemotaxis protein